MKFYILADGPDDATPDFACNIWGIFQTLNQFLFVNLHLEKINQEFPYFSELVKRCRLVSNEEDSDCDNYDTIPSSDF